MFACRFLSHSLHCMQPARTCNVTSDVMLSLTSCMHSMLSCMQSMDSAANQHQTFSHSCSSYGSQAIMTASASMFYADQLQPGCLTQVE
jgi:hypothetical protein